MASSLVNGCTNGVESDALWEEIEIIVPWGVVAAAGFYKCNPDDASSDECACFYCEKTLGDWDAEDDPFKEHKFHSTNCKFINLDRPEAKLKVKEFIDLMEAWCIHQMDKKN